MFKLRSVYEIFILFPQRKFLTVYFFYDDHIYLGSEMLSFRFVYGKIKKDGENGL